MTKLEKQLAVAEHMICEVKRIAADIANEHCACGEPEISSRARKVEALMTEALSVGICLPGAGGFTTFSGRK